MNESKLLIEDRCTLSDVMRIIGRHPQDKLRSKIKKLLTPLEPLKFGNKNAIYSRKEAEELAMDVA